MSKYYNVAKEKIEFVIKKQLSISFVPYVYDLFRPGPQDQNHIVHFSQGSPGMTAISRS